jgi:hypothetical protein
MIDRLLVHCYSYIIVNILPVYIGFLLRIVVNGFWKKGLDSYKHLDLLIRNTFNENPKEKYLW